MIALFGRRSWCSSVCVAFLLLAISNFASAATLSLSPVTDAFGTDQPADGNFDSLFPASPANIVGGGGNAEYRSALEFALAPIPAGSNISSVKLVLHRVASSGSSGSMNVFVHSYVGNGTSEFADLLVQNQVSGPYFLTFSPPVDLVEADVTTAIRNQFLSNVAIAGLSLRTDSPAFAHQFGSVDNPTVANRPTLEIVYTVPEPSPLSMAIFACGLLLTVGAVKSRKALAEHSVQSKYRSPDPIAAYS